MARSMNLDVLVRLRDRLSPGLRRLRGNIRSLVNAGRQIGFIGTAIAAISFLGPIKEAAAFEQKLLDIAGTANLSGQAAFDFARNTRREYEALALAAGQTSETVADGAGQMIAAGVAQDVVDRTLEVIGKSATAASAELSEMAAVSTALMNTLNVPESELEGALAGLVVAGKEGAFELKDMARYYAQLTGQIKKFGIEGREASDQLATLLQIAKKGTSDPGQAANNLNNFLSKALAPVTIKKFAEMDVDIEAVMKDAAAKGINPLEAMLQKIGKLTGVSADSIGKYMAIAQKRGLEGGEALAYVRNQLEAIGGASRLGELFQDQQVLDFLIPMLANIDEYKRIKAEVATATGADIDADFETKMKGLTVQLRRLQEIGTQAVRDVGFAFGEWLPMINGYLEAALKWMRELDAATGGWVQQALVAAGGGILLVGAIGALGLALPIVIAGFSALASLAAVALGPIGLLIGAIALGAVHVAKNWDRYGPRLMRIWDRTRRGFTQFAGDLVDRGRDIVRRGRELVDRYGPAVREGVGRAWQEVSRIAGTVAARLPSFDTIKVAGLEALAGVLERLKAIGTASLDVIGTSFRGFIDGLTANFDLSGFANGFDTLLSALGRVPAIIGNLRQIFSTDTGVDPDVMGAAWKRAGELIGQGASLIGDGFERLAGAIDAVLSGLERITTAVRNGDPVPWTEIFPAWVIWIANMIGAAVDWVARAIAAVKDAVNGLAVDWEDLFPATIAGVIETIASKVGWLADKISGLTAAINAFPGMPDFSVGAFGSTEAGRGSQLGKNPLDPIMPGEVPTSRAAPANSNAPASDQRSSLASPTKLAAAVPASKADVSGRIEIAVSGPGKVTSAKSSNSQIAMAPDRGRAGLGNAA